MMTKLERLQEALERVLKLTPKVATQAALTVLNYFGHNTVIIDNTIAADDRKLFYQLHNASLLNTFWETVILPNGRAWRSFYWELDEQAIDRAIRIKDEKTKENVYDSLPNGVWVRAADMEDG